MYLSHDEAIDDAEWIVRAKGITRADGGIKMRAIEYLKGAGPETFVLPLASTHGAQFDQLALDDSNFFGHNVSEFWVHGGRSHNKPDCDIHPAILFGDREYLIFGPLDYNVGFENIAAENDIWLRYVRDYVNGKSPSKPFPQSIKSYISNVFAIVQYSAEWDGKQAVWLEKIIKGNQDSYANMLFVSPAAYFDTAVNPNCFRYGEPRKLSPYNKLFVVERLPAEEIQHGQYLECAGADRGDAGSINAVGSFSRSGTSEIDIVGAEENLSHFSNHGRKIWVEEGVTVSEIQAVMNEIEQGE